MHTFSKQITVTPSDLDDLEHVNNVRYVQWIQDISKEHWEQKAPQEIKEAVLWVVLTHHIEYKAPALLHDPITISNHIAETKGATSIRVVEMKHSETNVIFIRSTTAWCLLNKENNKPMRVSGRIQKILVRGHLPSLFLTMFQKSVYIVLVYAAVVAITSCRKDFEYAPSAGNLEFSMDTVYLDTVFKNISSSTYILKVYNTTRDDVLIPSIELKNGPESAYRLNVDGRAGQSFENIPLNAQDSLFISIEITVEQLPDTLDSFLYTDVLSFDSGTFLQEIPLITLVKDAQFLFPPTMGSGEKSTVTLRFYTDEEAVRVPGFELTDEQLTFTSQKPYVVYGLAVVPQGKTLTIEAGARVHFHKDAGLLVRSGAQLIINGALSLDQKLLENEVVFEGDRLEPSFHDLPGQWNGVLMEKEGLGHSISYLTIKNAKVGLFIEGDGVQDLPALTLRNTQIHNSSEHNLWARNAHLVAENTVFGGAGNTSFYGSLGGYYSLTHCTIANYWNKGFRRGPALRLDNNMITSSGQTLQQDLERAHFRNCIIDGNGMQELALTSNDTNTFNFVLDYCLLKYKVSDTAGEHNPLFDFNDALYYKGLVLNGQAAFFEAPENDFRISQESEATAKGDPQWASQIPLDLLGTDRAATPDLGAYQVIFKAMEE